MIEKVLNDYFEDAPEVPHERVEYLRKVLVHYDAKYLSSCIDEEMHYAYLCAFLYRLDRVPDEDLKDFDKTFQNPNIEFYLDMDEDEKRIDAISFKKNDELLRKAEDIRANALRLAIKKVDDNLSKEDIDFAQNYMVTIDNVLSETSTLGFSSRREAEQLLSDATLDLAYVLEDTKQYSPELFRILAIIHPGQK